MSDRTNFDAERVQRLALVKAIRGRVSEPARAADAARQLMRQMEAWRDPPDTADLQALLGGLAEREETSGEA